VVQLVHPSNPVVLFAPTTCSSQRWFSIHWYLWFLVQQLIGTLVYFEDIDPAHVLGLEPELDWGPDIEIDQDSSSLVALAPLAEFVLPTDTNTLLQFLSIIALMTLMISCPLMQQILSKNIVILLMLQIHF
jgi:hypothetical protein